MSGSLRCDGTDVACSPSRVIAALMRSTVSMTWHGCYTTNTPRFPLAHADACRRPGRPPPGDNRARAAVHHCISNDTSFQSCSGR